MKPMLPILFLRELILAALVLAPAALAWGAGPYDLPWSAVAGGGGSSTGGVYSVAGTVGQVAVGSMSGTQYAVLGAFWSFVVALPEPGAPTLTIRATPTNTVVVAWPDPSTGFVLLWSSDLNRTNWFPARPDPVVVGGERHFVVSPQTGTRYYRLKKSGP